ncbi:hypothetical protein RHMOL_Rhmol03G0107600 [Rhododendron molle]|uniref:Uncharacterized protein n=1 Tax=Rhododendron molle TaxID=49168 RepID=A0ACC0PDX2_RHOML|nr:hypothetical protein RHMOL_Rhmol03G0107600 [Rhododendron molle]
MSEIRAKWKALGDKAKQKYIEKAKLSSEAYKEKKVKVNPQEDSKETFITRTQLKTACDIIRNLEPQQVESVKAMGFGAKDFISPCACRPSPRLVQWGDEETRDRIHWLDQSSSRKLKIIVEDGVGKRQRVVDQGKEIGQNIPIERFEGIEELNGILKKLASIMETMDVRGKKTSENSLAAKINMEQDMKEPKIKPSSKRSRKMATNIGDIMSSTATPTIGMNKRQKKCQQEMPRTRLKGSQPVKKNVNEKPTMEYQQEMESQPMKKNANESYALNGGITSRTWVKYYGGSSRYIGFLESVERVYIPINENNSHWFKCVVNFKDANVYVLDSLPSLSKRKVQNEKVLRVLEYLDDVIQHLGNNGCVIKAHKLPIKRLKWLPVQESGSDDCGVHTAKYYDLEQFNEEEAAKLRFISEEGRNNLILDLILCGENEIRNEVIRKAQERYRNTRRII